MKNYWERIRAVIDDMSLRERAMIFLAAAFVVISLIDVLLLDPLLARQKILSTQVVQQQEKMKELQAQMQNLMQAKQDDEHSPLRERIAQLKQQLLEQDSYLQSRRRSPGRARTRWPTCLQQVLNKNGRLQLVELKTLPVSLLIETPQGADVAGQTTPAGAADGQNKRIRKSRSSSTVCRSRCAADTWIWCSYVTALEKLPAQMFWGEASLSVVKYPDGIVYADCIHLESGQDMADGVMTNVVAMPQSGDRGLLLAGFGRHSCSRRRPARPDASAGKYFCARCGAGRKGESVIRFAFHHHLRHSACRHHQRRNR